MTDKTFKAHGFWNSPLSAALVATGALRFGRLQVSSDAVYWSEGRPAEGGRTTIMRSRQGGEAEELLPAPYSARSRVHEYGGGESYAAGSDIYFVNDKDQQIYCRAPLGGITRLTDAPDMRFADFVHDGQRNRLIAVAERSSAAGGHGAHPENCLVSVPLGTQSPNNQIAEIVSGQDFFASPRLSADGKRLAWLSWNLPAMPWDEAALYVAEIGDDGGLLGARRIAGGDGSTCFQPEWSSDGSLYFIWDADGWGNLFRWNGETVRRVTRFDAELSKPLWSFNLTSYALLDGDRAAVSFLQKGTQHLGLVDLRTGAFEPLSQELTAIHAVSASDEGIACLALSDLREVSVYWFGKDVGKESSGAFAGPSVIREGSSGSLDAAYIPAPQILEFENRHGDAVFGTLYPPRNPSAEPEPGALPPLILNLHGGPTSNAARGLKSRILYFTTRGFAWLDLDYSGSTGYGRAYRDRLTGEWGVRDVSDTIDAAHFVQREGIADPDGLFLTGSSSGGYTVLMALTQTALFRGAASSYGICDLRALQRTTHKFESGYISTLVGARLEDDEQRYLERSAIHYAERIWTPLLLLQGADDMVVPTEQSQAIADALESKGVRVEYLLFEGEGHGFRKADTVIRALEAELAFYQSLLSA